MTKKYEPTDEQRRTVRAMAAFGVPQTAVGKHFELDAKTLRKHFRRELDRGMVEANVKVAQSLFTMATSGSNVAAAIFWMKARAGWREKNDLEITGRDGKPLQMETQTIEYRWATPTDKPKPPAKKS